MSAPGVPSAAGDVVPLTWRVAALEIIRGVGAAVLLVGSVVDGGLPDAVVLELLLGYAVVSTVLSALVVTVAHRPTALGVFGLMLCVDGVAVEAARRLDWTGASGVVLPAVLLASVCLLGSFRTGIKLAVWQSLLTVLRDGAERTGLLQPLPGGGSLGAELVLLWLLVLVVGTAAAVSERELRRRRYDAEALQRFATRLHECDDPQDVVADVVDFVADELDAGRVLACHRSGTLLERIGSRGIPAAAPDRGDWAPRGLLTYADRPGGTERVQQLDAVRDPWLVAQLPDAQRLVVLPVRAPGEDVGTWVVFGQGRARAGGRGGSRAGAVERRVLATAGQAGATAALALERALLFRAQRLAATTDGLTGVANRRTLDELLAGLDAAGQPYAVVLTDVDHFKKVNDTHGHQAGDDVLVAVAAVLRAHVPPGGTAARYGGEEFVVVLPGAHRAAAAEVAEVLRRAVAAIGEPVPVTASFGVAVSVVAQPGGGVRRRTAEETVARADAALYRAKQAGRDRVVTDEDGTDPAGPDDLPRQQRHAAPAPPDLVTWRAASRAAQAGTATVTSGSAGSPVAGSSSRLSRPGVP